MVAVWAAACDWSEAYATKAELIRIAVVAMNTAVQTNLGAFFTLQFPLRVQGYHT